MKVSSFLKNVRQMHHREENLCSQRAICYRISVSICTSTVLRNYRGASPTVLPVFVSSHDGWQSQSIFYYYFKCSYRLVESYNLACLPSMLTLALRWFFETVRPFSTIRLPNLLRESCPGPDCARRLSTAPDVLLVGRTEY